MTCGCCQERSEEDNDIALFSTLTDCNGVAWAICGPCIQIMWQARAPRFDADPQPMT